MIEWSRFRGRALILAGASKLVRPLPTAEDTKKRIKAEYAAAAAAREKAEQEQVENIVWDNDRAQEWLEGVKPGHFKSIAALLDELEAQEYWEADGCQECLAAAAAMSGYRMDEVEGGKAWAKHAGKAPQELKTRMSQALLKIASKSELLELHKETADKGKGLQKEIELLREKVLA